MDPRNPPTIASLKFKLGHSFYYSAKTCVRCRAIGILETLINLAQVIDGSEYIIHQSIWEQAVIDVENQIVKDIPELRNINLGRRGLVRPNYHLSRAQFRIISDTLKYQSQ